jgi:hypothetical protein
MSTREKRIQEIAYHLWEQEGRPDGHSERLWLAAEAQYEADLAKGRYEAELAKERAGLAARNPARAKKTEPSATMPARPAPAKAASPAAKMEPAGPAPEKKAPAAMAKGAEPEKPQGAAKRKPKAT